MSDANETWGQGAVNNDIGWGSGVANNSIDWGFIHPLSWGHPRTNLVGIGEDVIDFVDRVEQGGGVIENPEYIQDEVDFWKPFNPTLLNIPSAYAEDKAFSIIPENGDGDYTWTRATTRTRINSEGEVEEVPPNLIQYSNDFTNGVWTDNNVTITPNFAVSPDGNTNATRLVFGSGSAFLSTTLPVGVGSEVATIYIKGVSGEVVRFGKGANVGTGSLFTLSGEWQRLEFIGVNLGANYFLSNLNGATAQDVLIYEAQVNTGTEVAVSPRTTDRLDVPALDYGTGVQRWSLEPSRTNNIAFSNDFTNAIWSNSNITLTENFGVSPDGNTNSTKCVFGSGTAFLSTVLTVGVGSEIATIYIKGVSGEIVRFGKGANVGTGSLFTLSGEWQRLEFSGVDLGSNYFLSNLNGATAQEVEIYGAQLEAGAYPTSYIPTSGSAVTRAGDLVKKSGITQLIGASEGTFYVDAGVFYDLDVGMGISLNDGSVNNRVFVGKNVANSELVADVRVGGVQNPILRGGNWVSGENLKIAIRYAPNNFALFVNGVKVDSSSSGSTFGANVLNTISFDIAQTTVPFLGNVGVSALFDYAMTDEQAEFVTATAGPIIQEDTFDDTFDDTFK